ncbi:hypothetical protein K1719_022460 [Acacia pycnantha]|nr:hypothetical protein K1719_022460 [Acacia pycnantha]
MTPPPSSKPAIQFHHLRHLKQDPPLSASSIRNLVKHFTATSKTSMNPDPSPALNPNSTVQGTVLDASQTHKSPHRQPHKRQVRRRLHTARPYHDMLLNVAEARKEIVTALKFHRANSLKQQQQPKHQDEAIMSPANPVIYGSSTNNHFSNLVNHLSFSSFSHPTLSLPDPLNSPAASSSLAPPQLVQNLCLNLPNRTLGLNLNFQNFDNLGASLCFDNNNASFFSYSSLSSSSSPSFSVSTDQEVPSVAISLQGEGNCAPSDAIDSIAATQVALCPKFMKNTEHQATEDDAAYPIFDAPMEFPEWLNANERCFEHYSQEFDLDPALPCMEIGDFEGVGEEWLA